MVDTESFAVTCKHVNFSENKKIDLSQLTIRLCSFLSQKDAQNWKKKENIERNIVGSTWDSNLDGRSNRARMWSSSKMPKGTFWSSFEPSLSNCSIKYMQTIHFSGSEWNLPEQKEKQDLSKRSTSIHPKWTQCRAETIICALLVPLFWHLNLSWIS